MVNSAASIPPILVKPAKGKCEKGEIKGVQFQEYNADMKDTMNHTFYTQDGLVSVSDAESDTSGNEEGDQKRTMLMHQ